MKRILILFGGCSSEHEVSLQSAHAVLTHLNPERYEPLAVGITRDGRFLYYPGHAERLLSGDWAVSSGCVPCTLRLDRGQARLLLLDGSGAQLGFDAAFPVLHGKNGEDGTIQGLLELAGIPIVGCGTLASALCMDKVRAHALAAAAGIPTPQGKVLHLHTPRSEWERTAEALGYPLFVKPVHAGSSFGISRVTSSGELPQAIALAFEHDHEVVLEQEISGFEVGCAVMGNPGETPLTVGAVDEIELSGGFFDFEEKYTLKTSAIHCPARISPALAQAVRASAETVYTALGCRGFARVDFFLTPAGEILFNEVNTIPGFTAHSRYPSMMEKIGLDFASLIDQLIQLGVGQ